MGSHPKERTVVRHTQSIPVERKFRKENDRAIHFLIRRLEGKDKNVLLKVAHTWATYTKGAHIWATLANGVTVNPTFRIPHPTSGRPNSLGIPSA